MRHSIGALVLGAVLGLTGCNSDNDSGTHAAAESYTLVVMPDTQKYSRYNPERYNAQTQWIADNYKQQNIVFTAHLGDVVDLPDSEQEWLNARAAMSILEANPATPYSILAGNHDVLAYRQSGVDINSNFDSDRTLAAEPFLKHFPASLQQNNFASFQGTDATGFNSYHLFKGGEREYLLLALDWRTSAASIAWAQSVLDAHPETPTILTTHQLLNVADDGNNAIFTDNGAMLWDKLIKDNDQIFLTFNGHHHGEAKMVAKNRYGRDVVMILVDYQSGFWGGNGMLQLVSFDEANKRLQFRSFSPWVAAIPEAERQPQDVLQRWEFEQPLDFEKRFAKLNQEVETEGPGKLEGTLAYWIFDAEHKLTSTDPTKVQFMDLSGRGNTLSLKAKAGSSGTQEQLFELLGEAPGFGHATGAARFKGGNTQGGYYLSSQAPTLVSADGQAGVLPQYTIEMIVRLAPEWQASENAWGAVFAHKPSQSQVCEHHKLDCGGGDPSLALTASSLKEFQWISTSSNGVGPSNWSWEVDRDYWYHVAIVNDGQYATMYVDNSRVMRTAEAEQHGLMSIPGGEWMVGASSWDGEVADLFRGDIAEIRIVDRVLPESDWLNAK